MRAIISFLFALVALNAAAFAAPAKAPKPAAFDVATAKAEGDALLKAAHAEDLFDNETGRDKRQAIVLRHRLSGFPCFITPGQPQNMVRVYRSLVRGEDVSCTTTLRESVQMFYFYKVPEKSAERLLADAEEEISAGGELVPDDPDDKSSFTIPKGAPVPLSGTYRGGDHTYHLTLGKIGDWAVQARYEGDPTFLRSGGKLDLFWVYVATARKPPTLDPKSLPAHAPLDAAAVKTEGDSLLARADAQDLFENISTKDGIELRHRASGLICTFDADSPDSAITIFPGPLPRGDDIKCDARVDGAIVNLFVSRVPGTNTDEMFDNYLKDIDEMHPDTKAAEGVFGDVSAEHAPPHKSARVTYTDFGRTVFSRLSVTVIGDWVLEQRVTAPLDQATAADLLGEMQMNIVSAQLQQAQSSGPR